MKNVIILYRPDELAKHIEVRLEGETVWLNRQQISMLFDRDVKTIGKHINNVFSERELDEKATVVKFAIVQNEGGRIVERQIEFYNLDTINNIDTTRDPQHDVVGKMYEYFLSKFALAERKEKDEPCHKGH